MPILTLLVGGEYIIRVPEEKNKQLLFGKLDGKRIIITEVGKDFFKFEAADQTGGPGFLFNTHIPWLELAGELCGCSTRTLMLCGCICGGI